MSVTNYSIAEVGFKSVDISFNFVHEFDQMYLFNYAKDLIYFSEKC